MEGGDADALQVHAGAIDDLFMYAIDQGQRDDVNFDQPEFLSVIHKLASLEHGNAEFCLGKMYQLGGSVDIDLRGAAH